MAAKKQQLFKDFDYRKLRDVADNRLSSLGELPPPVTQEDLEGARDYSNLGSLASALSGMVGGAGSVQGKLPESGMTPSFFQNLGQSKFADLSARESLRKSQEDEIYNALEKTGIAEQERKRQERLNSPLADMDKEVIRAKLKEMKINDNGAVDLLTYGDVERQPFLNEAVNQSYDWSKVNYQQQLADMARDMNEMKMGKEGAKALWRGQKASDAARKAYLGQLQKVSPGITDADIPPELTNGQIEDSLQSLKIGGGAVKPQAPTGNKPLTQNQINVQRKQLSDKLAKERIPNAVSLMEEIQAIISKYPKDIPGIGKDGLIPNWGVSILGSAGSPTYADASKLRNLVQSRLNELLQARAGSAVTRTEFDRVAAELAAGKFATDQEFINAFNNSKRALREMIRNTWSGYDQKVIGDYTSGYTDESGSVFEGGRDFGKWMQSDTDYVPGEAKKSVPAQQQEDGVPPQLKDKSKDQFRGMLESEGVTLPNTPSAPPKSGGKIRMTNGKETLDVDPADEAAAAKEGFRRVK